MCAGDSARHIIEHLVFDVDAIENAPKSVDESTASSGPRFSSIDLTAGGDRLILRPGSCTLTLNLGRLQPIKFPALDRQFATFQPARPLLTSA